MIGDFVCGDAKLPADHEAEKPEVAALLKEIAVQRELIDDILGGVEVDHISLARNEKILGQLELRYQLMAEKDRLESVLEKFEEKHGSLYSELCLLCLEDINVNSSANLVTTFACCGGFICNNCADDFIVKDANKQQCPLCRASYGYR